MQFRIGFGDFELNEARFELRRCGEPVTVQPKVLELLLYLAKNRDRVVSKDELFETIWDGTAVTEASLNRAVSLARKALDDTPTAQRVIRTVRGKGLQFVATPQRSADYGASGGRRGLAKLPVAPRKGSTQLETAQDDARRVQQMGEVPLLFAVLHGEAPSDGGASWSLAEVDEVHIVRGSRRKVRRESGLTRLLTITIPGRLLSRRHARMVRAPGGWLVVDEGSRNGTFVNGEPVKKRDLIAGDLIECGRTVFLFTSEQATYPLGEGTEERGEAESILASVMPHLLALEQDVRRVAPSTLPVLLLGESGTGKSRLAETIHGLSGRSGALVRLDAATLLDAGRVRAAVDGALRAADGGTVIIESLERVDDSVAALFSILLESAPQVRVICTTQVPFATLEARVPRDLLTRLAGYRCELPPLRERIADLGVLISALLDGQAATPSIEPSAALALLRYDWPGNLRELALVVEAASIVAAQGTIRVGHLPAQLRGEAEAGPSSAE